MSPIRRDVTPCLGRSNKALTLYSQSHGSNTVNILISWACAVTLISGTFGWLLNLFNVCFQMEMGAAA